MNKKSVSVLLMLAVMVVLAGCGKKAANTNKVSTDSKETVPEILYELFENGDEDKIKAELSSQECIDFTISVKDSGENHIYIPEDETALNGNGVGFYYVASPSYGDVFVYYGEYENGLRNGTGIWVGVSDESYYWFEGSWENDKPNGYGEVNEWKASFAETVIERRKKGDLADGLWNGDVDWFFIHEDKEKVFKLPYKNGYSTPIETKTEGEDDFRYRIAKPGEEGLWFSKDPSAYTQGIIGFDDLSSDE